MKFFDPEMQADYEALKKKIGFPDRVYPDMDIATFLARKKKELKAQAEIQRPKILKVKVWLKLKQNGITIKADGKIYYELGE